MANRLLKLGMLATLALALSGCTSFEATATRRYVDENNNYVVVEEGTDREFREFTTTLPNGRTIIDKTKSKIRLTLPDGRRFIMYKRLSPYGNLFKTDDEDWEYLVQGVECLICRRPEGQQQYALSYRGTLCATETNPLNEKRRSMHRFSSPSDFKSPTTNGDSSNSKAKW